MQAQTVFCSGCQRPVQIAWTSMPSHDGHAPLRDGPELVCLELGSCCTDAVCPVSGLPRVVMGVRLARSGLRQDKADTVHARCGACGEVTDLELVDAGTVFCPLCESSSRYAVLEAEDEAYLISHAL